jgi:1,4-alpha-glucan branching enzyme
MWARIRACERALEATLANSRPERERFLTQACREALLVQSSDWPFLITTGQAAEYARQRFDTHSERFHLMESLARAADPSGAEVSYLEQVEASDQLFAFLRPEWFASRQGSAS